MLTERSWIESSRFSAYWWILKNLSHAMNLLRKTRRQLMLLSYTRPWVSGWSVYLDICTAASRFEYCSCHFAYLSIYLSIGLSIMTPCTHSWNRIYSFISWANFSCWIVNYSCVYCVYKNLYCISITHIHIWYTNLTYSSSERSVKKKSQACGEASDANSLWDVWWRWGWR